MRHYGKLLFFVFIYLIHGNDLKISGPLLVQGGFWDWLKSCCTSNCCSNSCSRNSDKANSSNSSNRSGFELDIKSDDIKSDDNHFDVEKSYGRDLYIITFKAVVECSSVKVDGEEVWKDSGSKSEDVNPRTVTFCKDENRVRIHFGDHTIVYKKVNDKWKDTSDLKATSTNSTSGGSTATSGNGTSQPSSGTLSSGGTEKTSGGSGDGSQGTTPPAGGANQNPDGTSH